MQSFSIFVIFLLCSSADVFFSVSLSNDNLLPCSDFCLRSRWLLGEGLLNIPEQDSHPVFFISTFITGIMEFLCFMVYKFHKSRTVVAVVTITWSTSSSKFKQFFNQKWSKRCNILKETGLYARDSVALKHFYWQTFHHHAQYRKCGGWKKKLSWISELSTEAFGNLSGIGDRRLHDTIKNLFTSTNRCPSFPLLLNNISKIPLCSFFKSLLWRGKSFPRFRFLWKQSSNVCTWQLCCDCQKCRNLWTIF